MNKNVFSLKKNTKENNKENKAKEEEDIIQDINIGFEVIHSKYNQNYDYIVAGMRIKDCLINRYFIFYLNF